MRPERAAPIDDRGARLAEVLARFNLPAMLARYGVPGAEHADALQDLQIAIWMRAGDLPADEKARREMLLRIACDVAKVCRRRAGKAAARFAAAVPETPDPCDVHARLEARAQLEALLEVLDKLPPQQRTAIIAHGLDGHSPREIAARLGVSVNAVYLSIWRARAQLHKAIRDCTDEDKRAARAVLAPLCLGNLPAEHRAILRAVLNAEGKDPPLLGGGPPGEPPGPPSSRLPAITLPLLPKLAPWLAAGAGAAIVAAAVVLAVLFWPRPRPDLARGAAGLFALVLVHVELPAGAPPSSPGRAVLAAPSNAITMPTSARTSPQAGRARATAPPARGALPAPDRNAPPGNVPDAPL